MHCTKTAEKTEVVLYARECATLCYRGYWILAVVVSVCLRVCLCLSVTGRYWYCIKTVKRWITHTTPHDSPGTLVFLTQTVVGGRPHRPIPPEICFQSDQLPFEPHGFDQYPLIAVKV